MAMWGIRWTVSYRVDWEETRGVRYSGIKFSSFWICYIWWQRVPLVEQELPTLPEHLHSSPVLSGVRIARSLVFCVVFCRLCLSFFLLATAPSVFLRLTASDYPYSILKFFLQQTVRKPMGIKCFYWEAAVWSRFIGIKEKVDEKRSTHDTHIQLNL